MLKGGYFITSEHYGMTSQDGSEYVFPRYYKIREAHFETGNVSTLKPKLQSIDYKKDRKKYIGRLKEFIKRLNELEDMENNININIKKTGEKAEVTDLECALSDIKDQISKLKEIGEVL